MEKELVQEDYCSDCDVKITEQDCARNVCNACRLEI